MSRPLPDLADPVRLCAGGRGFSGNLPLADFGRLAERLVGDQGEVRFSLEFGSDERNVNTVRGWLETDLPLACERCGEEFRYPIRCEWQLGVVYSLEEADRLPEDCEPLLIDEARIRLKDILEDELLLALPLMPTHPEGECSGPVETSSVEQEQGSEPDNPFAVLEKLRNRKENSGE